MVLVDTNILINVKEHEKFFQHFKGEEIIILGEVIEELDKIKNREGLVGFQARRALRGVYAAREMLTIVMKDTHAPKGVYVDDLILEYLQESEVPIRLLTNDLSLRLRALSRNIESDQYISKRDSAEFDSIVYKKMSYSEYLNFTKTLDLDIDIKVGEYAVFVESSTMETLDILKSVGDEAWEQVDLECELRSQYFRVIPKDDIQRCAIDSLNNDPFSAIIGKAGTGKTLLSIGYILQEMQRGAHVHIFVNPVKTRDTEALGYYPGDRVDKLLQNNIGDILVNKIGARDEVLRLIETGILNIYPFSDIRGIEIREGDIMYITEAQNLSIDLIKLAIQRCVSGSKILIEGDPFAQVDRIAFEGDNNGLLRVLEVFAGEPGFGFTSLKNIYRSEIAEIAEKL